MKLHNKCLNLSLEYQNLQIVLKFEIHVKCCTIFPLLEHCVLACCYRRLANHLLMLAIVRLVVPPEVYLCFLGSVFISVRVRSNLKNFLSLLNFCFSDHGIGPFRYQIPLTKPEQVCLRLPQHYTFYCLASSCDPKRLILCKLMYWNRALLYSALE